MKHSYTLFLLALALYNNVSMCSQPPIKTKRCGRSRTARKQQKLPAEQLNSSKRQRPINFRIQDGMQYAHAHYVPTHKPTPKVKLVDGYPQ